MFKKVFLACFAALFLSATLAFAADKININSASQQELESIKGVGPATAAAIIEYREQKGGFVSVEELTNVKGIGEKRLSKIADDLTVSADE